MTITRSLAPESISYSELETMSDHKKGWHHRDHHANPPEGENRAAWRRVHKDWRLWVIVGLMLLGILAYVMTMDEAVQPGGKVQEPVPAAPGL